MTSFTPGPWESNCFLVVAKSRPGGLYGGQEICHTGGGRTNGDEAEANATLIAAAPELLAALQVSATWLEWWLANDDCGCEPEGHRCGKPQRQLELRQCKDAITKALGTKGE